VISRKGFRNLCLRNTFLYCKKKEKSSKVVPVITPRFAITSTSKQLTNLAQLAKENNGMFI